MWPNPQENDLQETAYLVIFTEEILKGKLYFLYSEKTLKYTIKNCVP